MTPEERIYAANELWLGAPPQRPIDLSRPIAGDAYELERHLLTVKLTPEILEAWWASSATSTSAMDALAAAFRAAGFIVEE